MGLIFTKGIFFCVLLISLFFQFHLQSFAEIIKKKIVFVKDDDSDFINYFTGVIEEQFAINGWDETSSDFIVFSMEGTNRKGPEIIKKIKEIKPDVVFINGLQVNNIALPLLGTEIPVVLIGGIEKKENGKYVFLNESADRIKSNVNGTFLMPKDYYRNSVYLLEKMAPLNGKEIVILVQPNLFDEESMKNDSEELGIKVKHYEEFEYFEDYQKALLEFNNDPDVGWIICDGPVPRKDKKTHDRIQKFQWEYANVNKPHFSFWQNNVENGALMGIAINSMGIVLQGLNMCYEILDGQEITNIKPDYPQESYLLLNMHTAQRLKIDVPIDVLGAVWRVYTDANGNYLSHE